MLQRGAQAGVQVLQGDVLAFRQAVGSKQQLQPVGHATALFQRCLQVVDAFLLDGGKLRMGEAATYLVNDVEQSVFDDISVMPARILVVGLGNPTLTPDALGPRTAERIKATMHIREYDEELFDALECSEIATISPGVSAHTGLDTGVIIKAICEAISPDVVIAVDSLMTRSENRLGRTIQISDSGIFPGGLGNLKTPITRSGVGVPVIGIGVPTVISSRLLTNDLGDKPILTEPHLLVPKNIDEITRVGARVISGAINQAFGLDA